MTAIASVPSIPSDIIYLATTATSDHVDGWNKSAAREQLRQIKENTKNRRIKEYIQGLTG